jgi:peptidylprolyl isomerase
VSNRVRERRLAAQIAAGRPTKRERRALGKKAAAARAAARRRRLFLKNAGTVIAAVAVVTVIVLTFTVFRRGPASEAAAEDINTRPTVTAGQGTITTLKVTTRIQGTGPAVKAGQTISVNYVGVNYSTGEVFDASWDHTPAGPTSFEIGTGKVIKGWDQGLVGVNVGSRVQLDIPAALAYPSQTSGPTAGALRFVVDILSATDATASASPTPSASPSASSIPAA